MALSIAFSRRFFQQHSEGPNSTIEEHKQRPVVPIGSVWIPLYLAEITLLCDFNQQSAQFVLYNLRDLGDLLMLVLCKL